jgi:CheY-like chemotaxis protein
VSLKILIADDSMTAQNMGKKILADAGFDVVPVSNGAAAMKKIAETKPDIIVVDIFMPGYNGLEVCEKVKNAPETAHVPVLLTVGKLEPYRPEEGAKVRAEGVIIKPFEASDLLGAIARIAEKYNLNVPQIDPVEIEPAENAPQEFPMDEPAPMQVAAAAAVPAFVESVSAPAEEHKQEVPSFIREASAAAAAPAPMFIIEDSDDAPAPAYNLSDLIGSHNESPAYLMDEPMSVADVEVPAPEPQVAFSASSVPDPTPTGSWNFGNSSHSIVDEALSSFASAEISEVPGTDPVLETTAAEKVEVQVENLVELESTPEGPIEVEPAVDPALVTDPEEMMKFTVKVGEENDEAIAEDSASIDEPWAVEAMSEVEAASSVGDDTAEFAHEPQSAHSFHDDPMVQMGAIVIEESPAPSVEPAPPAEVGDDTMKLSLHSSFGLEGALHEFEATEEPAQAAVEEPVAETPSEPWEAVAVAEPTPEPESAQDAFSSFVPESTYPTNVVAEMAAVSPELEHEPEVIVVPEPSHDYASVASAIDSVVEEKTEDTKILAAAAGMDASIVARAVQKVFERYREQMVADITDELSKGE